MFCVFKKLAYKNLRDFSHRYGKLSLILHIHSCAKQENLYKFVRKPLNQSNPVLSYPVLKNLLEKCCLFQEQNKVFQTYIKLTNEDIILRNSVREKVENIFKKMFPDCSVYLVGSSANGLGLKGSDVDFSFHFSNNSDSQNTFKEDKSENFSESKFPFLSTMQQLSFLKTVLEQSGIGDQSTIIPGRYPILNFKYNNLACDLSINNRIALLSTNLMQLCEGLDFRVAQLFRLVVYWGKHFKFIGGPKKFKSYAVFLLVVFFLQTRQPPILPTVQEIFCKTELLKNLDYKSFNINEHIKKFPQCTNSESLETLFREFFFFYVNIDYSSVICPLEAKLVDGMDFISERTDFELNTISIQDPLNLNWNVTTGVNWKHCKSYIKMLLSTCEVYHKTSYNSTATRNCDLIAVLDSSIADNYFAKKDFVEIQILLRNLPNFEDSKEEYLNKASESVFRILRDALLFQCSPLEPGVDLSPFIKVKSASQTYFKKTNLKSSNRKGEVEKTSSFNSKEVSSKCALFVAANSWNGRGNYSFQTIHEDEKNFINSEQKISQLILKNGKVNGKEEFHFFCESLSFYKDEQAFLNVTLISLNRDAFIPKLGIILKELVLKYADTYL